MKNLITSAALFFTAFGYAQTEELVNFQIDAKVHVTSFEAIATSKDKNQVPNLGTVDSIRGSVINLKLSTLNDYEFIINGAKTINISGSEVAQYSRENGQRQLANVIESSGLIFTVQVGAFKNTQPISILDNYNDVKTEYLETPGLTRYMIGTYSSREEALAAADSFKSNGFTGAFPVAYFNGKRISIAEACNQDLVSQN